MRRNDPREIVRQIVEAHGSAARWNGVEAIEADISEWGMLFTLKRVSVLHHVRVRAFAREPRFVFLNFPNPGQTGELQGNAEVRIVGPDGQIVASRLQPRAAFGTMRRQFYWDILDFIYFGGYATWNYLLFPFLFLRDGFGFAIGSPARKIGNWLPLEVSFPQDIPTHCSKQVFYFDEQWRLWRHDYTAELVGRWARASHFCEEYREFDGFQAPTRRRVRPRSLGNTPLRGPTLVGIDIHSIRSLAVQSPHPRKSY